MRSCSNVRQMKFLIIPFGTYFKKREKNLKKTTLCFLLYVFIPRFREIYVFGRKCLVSYLIALTDELSLFGAAAMSHTASTTSD